MSQDKIAITTTCWFLKEDFTRFLTSRFFTFFAHLDKPTEEDVKEFGDYEEFTIRKTADDDKLLHNHKVFCNWMDLANKTLAENKQLQAQLEAVRELTCNEIGKEKELRANPEDDLFPLLTQFSLGKCSFANELKQILDGGK